MQTEYSQPTIDRIGSLAQLTQQQPNGAPGNSGNNKPGDVEDLVGQNPAPDNNTMRMQGS